MTPFQLPASSNAQVQVAPGSKDGRGSAAHDQPYVFGRRPRGAAPFPFTTRQYARLLALRGRIADGLVSADDVESADLVRRLPAVGERGPRAPRLFGPCAVCGAVVVGASANRTCPKCEQDGGRDVAARAILETAGVLALTADESDADEQLSQGA